MSKAGKSKTGKVSEHEMIRDAIVNDIIRGVYEKGAAIPKQELLSEKYGVSRTTVRRATDVLIQNGILTSVKGKGTFVNEYHENVPQDVKIIREDHAERLSEPRAKTITIQKIVATETIARQLQIPTGSEVVYIERIRLLEGIPISVQISYLNGADVKNVQFTKEYLDKGSMFYLMERQAGLYASHQDEIVRAIGCPSSIASYLHLEPQSPVVMIFRTVFTTDGRIMEYCEDYENTAYKGLHFCTKTHLDKQEEDCDDYKAEAGNL